MSNKKEKNIDKSGITKYSRDKEYLNAIVVMDTSYHIKSKNKLKSFKAIIYAYAVIIFLVSAFSIGILGISDKFQQNNKIFISIIEIITFLVLSIDLIFRWYTSEVRIKKGNWSYLIFPFTIVGVMLIASLMPSLYLINIWTNQDIKFFEVLGDMKFLRLFRIILLTNMIPALGIFKRVLIKEKSTLYVVLSIVLITIIVFALVIYNLESVGAKGGQEWAIKTWNISNPSSTYTLDQVFGNTPLINDHTKQIISSVKIQSFLDAVYFSTIALTTIGFGDISPITTTGKVITIIISIIGIAVLATPSGVIAGAFISEVKIAKEKKKIKK